VIFPKCAPRLGEDNVKVYGEIGLGEGEVERMRGEGVV